MGTGTVRFSDKFQMEVIIPIPFAVSRARVCHYVAVWNALGEGSDVISSLSSAGMFLWQRSAVSISRFADGHRHNKIYILYWQVL